VDTIEHEELLQRLGDPELVLLDVLPRRVYERGHLPGARSLPLEEVPDRADELLEDGDLVVVYCVNRH
jgi:rhodanese-related sulfurtransferase